jgi:hypothetical protein
MKLVTFTSSKLFVTQSPPSPSTLFSVCDVLLIAEKAVQGFKLSFQKKNETSDIRMEKQPISLSHLF